MNLKFFPFVSALAAVLLAACGSASATAEVPDPDPFVTPAPTESGPATMPFPGDTPVLVWHRSGGIAGFCDDLTVNADGTYIAGTCVALPDFQRTGQLSPAQLQQLAEWVKRFASFDDAQGEGDTFPDAMLVKTSFKGAGTVQAGAEDILAINNFASLLVMQPRPDGGGAPQAVEKARDFLAGELAVSVDRIVVVSFESVEWPDRCLGVTVPGQLCAQGVTPGYQVTLQVGDQFYELHTDETGESVRMLK